MRVTFLIDGFNLYHSVKEAKKQGAGPTRWLDAKSLLTDYLYLFGRDAVLREVYYFSALAHHIEAFKPDVVARHKAFIQALESSGVRIELGRFKRKGLRCDACGAKLKRHEEKETDVAIAVKMMELCHLDATDVLVLVTGDTDLAPAVRTIKTLFPAVQIAFAFPYKRKNLELAGICPASFEIGKAQYAKHQFPGQLRLPNGATLVKPASW